MEGQIETPPPSDSAEVTLAALKASREALEESQKAIQSAIRVVNKAAREIGDGRAVSVIWPEG